MVLSSGTLLIRGMTIVLLAKIDNRLGIAFVGVDLSLYLLIKIARGDFWYWMPFGGYLEILMSIFARVGAKVINDFIAMAQLRQPHELGGLGWSLGVMFNLLCLPFAVIFYSAQQRSEDELLELTAQGSSANEFDWQLINCTAHAWNSTSSLKEHAAAVSLAWAFAIYLIPLNVVVFLTYLFSIKREYWKTFWSMQRGVDLVTSDFRNSSNESRRIACAFENSQHLTKSIKDEVITFLRDNWLRWEDEQPKWRTPALLHSIPLSYLPVNARQKESNRRNGIEQGIIEERVVIKKISSSNLITKIRDQRGQDTNNIEKVESVANSDLQQEKMVKNSTNTMKNDPVMDIFAQSKKQAEKIEKVEKVEAFDPIMDIFAQSKKQAEKAQKVEKVEAFDPVMDIFAQSKKQAGKADKVDPVMEIFEKAKEKEQEKNNKKDTGPKLQQNFWEL
jgi:hypothetical protein